MAARLTTADFVAAAVAKHGQKYDYSATVYTGSKNKVVIRCQLHGDSMKSPGHHLAGQGGDACAGKRHYTTATFIEAVQNVHGQRYAYGLTEFTGAQQKVRVYCREHGFFEVKAKHHLSGVGCASCAVQASQEARSYTTDQFIEAARAVQRQRYSYDLTAYTRSIEKVAIRCHEHGVFKQVASSHLNGVGYPKCAGKNGTTAEFIAKARAVHGNRYRYDQVAYTLIKNAVVITCPAHGYFEQTAADHLSGCGCPKCAPSGIWKHERGIVYVLAYGDGLNKIGIASDVAARLARLRRNTDDTIEVKALFPVGMGRDAWEVEQAAHRLLEPHKAGLVG